MAHYRKIDPRMWNDEKFRSLSTHGKLAFCFLLTHPHMTALGAMRATIPGLVAELGGEKGFAEGFREAFAKGLAKHDERASFVYLPRFLRYNPPESPNVVKAWAHSVDLIPECDLKTQLLQEVKGYVEGLSEAFREALPEAFAKGMPNQEQEQEQEQESRGGVAAHDSIPEFKRPAKKGTRLPEDWRPSEGKAFAYPADLNVEAELRKFRGYWCAKAGQGAAKLNWDMTWQNWVQTAEERGNYSRLPKGAVSSLRGAPKPSVMFGDDGRYTPEFASWMEANP